MPPGSKGSASRPYAVRPVTHGVTPLGIVIIFPSWIFSLFSELIPTRNDPGGAVGRATRGCGVVFGSGQTNLPNVAAITPTTMPTRTKRPILSATDRRALLKYPAAYAA